MKRLLLSLILCMSVVSASAVSVWCKAYGFTFQVANQRGNWGEWTNWQKCDIDIQIDLTKDVVTIYSNSPQVYSICSDDGEYNDRSGSIHSYTVYDQDGDFGTMMIFTDRSGNVQLIIQFSDIRWSYGVNVL